MLRLRCCALFLRKQFLRFFYSSIFRHLSKQSLLRCLKMLRPFSSKFPFRERHGRPPKGGNRVAPFGGDTVAPSDTHQRSSDILNICIQIDQFTNKLFLKVCSTNCLQKNFVELICVSVLSFLYP